MFLTDLRRKICKHQRSQQKPTVESSTIKYLKMDSRDTQITINNPGKILHFSDGVDEAVEEVATEVQSEPEAQVDPKSLTWGPWFSHYTWKTGNKVLNAVDYAGESLANFFGITTPKYQIEIDEYERLQMEKKRIEDESSGWIPKKSDGNIPLVLNEPIKVIDNPNEA